MNFSRSKLLLFLAVIPFCAQGVQTQKFLTDSYSDFAEGEAHGMTITSDGLLKLGPSLKKIATLPVSTSWAAVRDGKQNLYIAGGDEGQVFRVTADGTVTEFFKAAELQISCLALDEKGNLFAGSMPDGKIYRIEPSGKSSVFFEPKEKYIWAIQFDSEGNLFVGTGDKGHILKVQRSGKSSMFYDSDETHIRTLLWFKNHLFAGSEGNGLVYRFDHPKNDEDSPFVLYDSPYKEIKSLVAAPDGSIFVAAMGDKSSSGGLLRPLGAPSLSATPGPIPLGLDGGKKSEESAPYSAPEQPGSAEIIHILSDGTTERWWSDAEDAYALLLHNERRIWVGTGHKGRLLSLLGPRRVSVLGQLEADAVTAILPESEDSWLVTTANPCTLWSIEITPGRHGTYESRVFDSHGSSHWGAVDFRASPDVAKLSWETRTGNTYRPDKVWSAWTPLDANHRIQSPAARFIQYRITMEAGAKSEEEPGALDSVALYYQPANQGPRLSHIALTSANFELIKSPKPEVSVQPLIPSSSSPRNNPPKGMETSEDQTSFAHAPSIQQVRRIGWRSATWLASDSNQDELTYDVYYRAAGNSEWIPLQSHLSDPFVSWDGATWPDGEYYLKVTVTDLPSNTPETARQDETISEAFTIDNTAPAIHFKPIEETVSRGMIGLTISDKVNIVDQAEYSLDGADWRPLLPVTGLYDSISNAFVISIASLPAGDHYVVVRASDAADNIGTETFRFHK